jgi:hypothetical protein
MLRQFESLLQAAPKILALQIIDHDAIDAENFLVKIRAGTMPRLSRTSQGFPVITTASRAM